MGAASVLIGLTFMSIGSTHPVSATTQHPEVVAATKTTQVMKEQKPSKAPSAAATETTAKNTPGPSTKTENNKKVSVKAAQASMSTSQSTQKQTLTVPKKSSQMTRISKAAISEQKTQDTTIKNVDLSGTLSEMNSNINLKQGTTFNISGNFSNNGFEVNSVTDNQGNHVNYSDKDGKLALDFSKSINLMYNSNQNNPYQIPTFKDLDIDLSNLKPSDLTTKNNITTLNDNYDLTSKCTYNGTNTIAPMYQSVGKIISVDENNNQLLYPFTRVYNTSNVNNDTGDFKTILSADDIGNLNTPLTVTLPKISGYSAVNDAGTPIASITVNNILKNTVVKYKKNNPTEAGNLNIYPITDMSTTTPSVMTPIESIPLNQNITINFDTTFVANLNKKLPLDDQHARYNIIIDQTGRRISSIDLNTITDKSKDINLFLVRNAIDPQTIQVSAGKSKGVDINSENNYELFNENGKFVAYNVKDTLADSDQNHIVDDIDMSISNGSEVLYPTGITSIPNSGDADFTNMMGTFNPNTGKYNPITIQAYSQNGSRVIGNWQLQLGDSTYDGGYKNIIHVTFTSTDKTYQGPVQPIYIEGSSDGGPNPMIVTVNATVTLQDASVKFVDLNKAHPQNLTKYDETAQGAVDNQISFKIPVKDQIKKLEDLGYSLVSDNFDNGNKYYNDDSTKNQFVVYVNHKLGITPENVSVKRTINYQGILPNGKIVAVNGSPQGHSTDTQTTNFTRNAVVDEVIKQTVAYDTNQDLTTPTVTLQDGDRAWVPLHQSLSQVDSQTPDKVKAPDGNTFTSVNISIVPQLTVFPNSKNTTVLVTYKRKIGKANLLIVDEDNDMKQIELSGIQTNFDSEGNVGTPISFGNTAASVKSLENKGYIYVSTTFKPGIDFDDLNDENGDSQQYLIVMKHGQVAATSENPHGVDPSELTKQYTSTVYYQTRSGKNVAPESSQTSTWTRHLTVDAINGDIIKNGQYDTPWTPNKTYYDNFAVPSVKGYTVEPITKDGVHITSYIPGQKMVQKDLTDVVYYDLIPVIEQGSIRVSVHDVHTNQDLPKYGKYSGVENVGTKFTYNTPSIIDELTKTGYTVLNPTIVIPDQISKSNQNFIIYVDHKVIPVTPENPGNGLTAKDLEKSVTETVTYLVDGDQALASKVHLVTLHFPGKAYYDSVTKKWTDASGKELANQADNITWIATNGHDFDTVVSPLISGYRVIDVSGNYNDGKGNVKEITSINQNSENIAVVVTYAKIPVVPTKSVQNAQLIIRDVTPGQEKELGSFSQAGYEGDPISFKNASELVQDLLNENYAWDSASYNGEPLNAKKYDEIAFGKYDNLSDKQDPTQKWIINLIHRATPVSMKQTVTRDVKYVDEQGHEMPGLSPVHQEFTFTGKTATDEVTGSKKTSWSVSTHKLDDTQAIDMSNYQIINVREVNTSAKVNMENGVVASQQVTPTSQDSQVIITLAKKAVIPTPVENGTVVVNYIDQTEGKVLETKILTGKTGTEVDYSPISTIKNYTDKGYILEKDGYPTQDVRYPDGNKVYEIDFVHGTTTKTSSITGTQAVRYQGAGNLTPKNNVSTVKFEDSITYDKVTGKVIKDSGWTSPQTYKIVASPTVKGYTPDKAKVGGETVSVDKDGKGNIDRNYLVVYTKNATPIPHPDDHQLTSPVTPKQTPQQPQTLQTPSHKQNTNNPNPTPQNNVPTTLQTSTNSTPSKKPTPKKALKGKKYTPVSHKTPTIKENKKLIATKLKRVNANKVEFSHLIQKMKQDTNQNSSSKSIKEKGERVTVKSKKILATPKLATANKIANKKLKNQRELPRTGAKNDTLAGDVGLAVLATSSVILSSLLGVGRKRRR
ncbi:LPXTG-motif cell wall anchor domain protein [Lactobacillus intestinalis DSM 6629]|uniref:LPXTG-motif cell wall anchor domain protein n=2 Tax=Lactobacillus intestinalis TaxID=151781 RepID=A0ABR5PPH5_9LACO|nr:LPXTG-motif cell wall anchor domain protein [Lactobacillus intestinalis DSM 6629]